MLPARGNRHYIGRTRRALECPLPTSRPSRRSAERCCDNNQPLWQRHSWRGRTRRFARNRHFPRPPPCRLPAGPGCGPNPPRGQPHWWPSQAHPSAHPSRGPRPARNRLLLSARLWLPPAATATTLVAAVGTFVWPSQFFPQAATVPSAFRRQRVEAPGGDAHRIRYRTRNGALAIGVAPPGINGSDGDLGHRARRPPRVLVTITW